MNGKYLILFFLTLSFSPLAFTCVKDGNPAANVTDCCTGFMAAYKDNANPAAGLKCVEIKSYDIKNRYVCDQASCTGTGEKSCFNQRWKDLRSRRVDMEKNKPDLENAVEFEFEEYKRLLIKYADKDPRPKGRPCGWDFQCESFRCDTDNPDSNKRVCIDTTICRKATKDEKAPGPILCEQPFVEDGFDKCVATPISTYGAFLGINGDPIITKVPGDKCQAHVKPEMMAKIHQSMKAVRAFEWLIHSIHPGDDAKDCLKILEKLREKGVNPYWLAKNNPNNGILKKFNDDINKLLHEQNLLETIAKKPFDPKAPDGPLTDLNVYHFLSKRTEKQISAEIASGKDALLIMKRRNQIYNAYETEMALKTVDFLTTVKGINHSMNHDLKTGEEQWMLGPDHIDGNDFRCRGGANDEENVEDSWYRSWEKEQRAENGDLIDKSPVFASYLGFLNRDPGGSAAIEAAEKAALKHMMDKGPWNDDDEGDYYLMDPILASGLPFNDHNFGSREGTHSRDFRRESDESSDDPNAVNKFHRIHEFFKTNMHTWFAQANPQKIERYIYEPELVKLEARGCYGGDKLIPGSSDPEKNDTKCSTFNNFSNEIADMGFAQWWAYSAQDQDEDYDGYFENKDNWRIRLFNSLEVQFNLVGEYYKEIALARDENIKCIDTVIKDLETTQDPTGDGVKEGDVGSAPDLGGDKYVADGDPDSNDNKKKLANRKKLDKNPRAGGGFDIKTGLATRLQDGAIVDSTGHGDSASQSARLAALANASNALAAHRDYMNKANEKAKKNGVKFDEIDKAARNGMLRMIKASQGAVGAAAGGAGGGASGFSGGGKATLDPEPTTTDTGSDIGPLSTGGAAGGGGGGGGGNNYGRHSGDSGAYSVGGAKGGKDEHNLIENYEKDKAKYAPNEDDTLFKTVSKAYVRNLEKVLTRKKEGEDK